MPAKTRYTDGILALWLIGGIGCMAVSCSFEDPLLPDDCLQARQTEMVRIDDVRFGPLRADSWLTPADTVSAQDLFLNLAFGFALDAQEEEETLLPARAGFWPADFFRLLDSSSSGAMGYLVQDQTRLDCSPVFQVNNVSNIRIFLLSPFEDLQVGDDISFLFVRNDGSTVQRWRDFSRTSRFNQLRFIRIPSAPARIQLRFEVFTITGESFEWSGSTPLIIP